jgi:uncharacterized ion transporter superfamily protein YfcC
MTDQNTFTIPDTLVILGFILVFVTILTWIVPSGEFERVTQDGRTIVVPDTYSTVSSSGQGFIDLILSPIKGFIAASQIIAFVLIVGGAFKIIQHTQAIEGGLQNMLRFAERHPAKKHLIIPLLTILFSLAGATFGMSEETLVFILITIPLARSMGYDALVGVAIPFLGAGVGFAGAFSNPFTIGIAQAIAELPPFSGIGYRILVWGILTATASLFIMAYAKKIGKNPELSPLYNHVDSQQGNGHVAQIDLTINRKLVLVILSIGIIMLVVGVTQFGWYINEIAGLFIVMALTSAIIHRMKMNAVSENFIEGAKEMLTAGMVIGFSRGILILSEDGKIIDTMLFHIASLINEMPLLFSAECMFFFQTFLNFFIPSGSGQAALTMPIMTPLSDLIGLSRQTAVLAFQLGDGLSNMVIPTSGVTMGVLAVAKIPYQTWLRWVFPLISMLIIIGILALIPPTILFFWGPL